MKHKSRTPVGNLKLPVCFHRGGSQLNCAFYDVSNLVVQSHDLFFQFLFITLVLVHRLYSIYDNKEFEFGYVTVQTIICKHCPGVACCLTAPSHNQSLCEQESLDIHHGHIHPKHS